MFITLAFLLLLAHVPSLQATPIEKKNSTGSNQPTPHTISLNLPKPVTTLINTKQKSPPTSTKATPTKATTTKATPTKPSQVNKSVSPPAKPTPSSGQKTDKDKPAANSQPITVVISEGCIQKDQQKDVINSTKAQEKELSLKPGSPLVMTHRINLLPGGACTGGCEAEMAALKGRVEFLEKEMSALKKKCTACTGGQCPNNCSNQGKCEGGKCICHQGFSGPDCSTTLCPSNCNKKGKCVKGKCVCQQGYTGPDCRKGGDKRVKVTVETVTMKVPPEKEGTSSRKKTQLDKTIFLKKTDEKGHKQTVKADVTKPTVKQGDKTNLVKVQSNGTTTGKVVKTVGQVLLKHQGERHQEQATKGKTTIIKLGSEKHLKPDNKKVSAKQESVKKPNVRKENLKDHPVIQNVTQTLMKKSNRTSKVIFGGSDKGPKGSLNATVSVTKVVKTVGTQGSNVTDKTRVKISHGKGRVTINATSTEKDKKLSQSNVTTVLRGGAFGKKNVENQVNVTVTESKTHTKLSNRTSSKSTALGSVEVHNITSTGFILRWEAPQGMFKNFTVMRRELHIGGKEKDEQDVEATEKSHDTVEKLGSKGTLTMNVTESQKQSSNKTVSSAKAQSASGVNTDVKSMKKFSQVLSGTARSFHFRNLRPQTRYSISLFGSSPGSRSKIYRLTVSTGPEPPTDLVFSNITETSLSVSWTKPKSLVTAFKVMYASPAKGENGSMLVDSQLSHVLLSNLSPGSSYEISVSSSQDMTESEPVTATVVTVPDSPANLQAVNITDTKALLVWKPSQAKVDRYILSYGSTKSPNVTVTVMVSGNAVEHQLRGLHRSTLYTVKVMSQINSLQSKVVSTAFRTASGVKPQAVTAGGVTSNSAVISWKSPRLAFKSYRLTYQQAGQLAKEVILNPTVTQYELTGLHADTNYTVKVDGETEGLYIVVVSTEFSTAKLPYPFPADCSEVQLNGVQKSGEAEVYPEGGDGEPVWVYCDMETEGGGWTVFQRRMDGKTDFYRGWKDYGKGFGHLSAEFWLGNDLLHALTSLKPMSLRIDLRAGNDTAYAHYSNFSVDSEANNYAIEISGYSGTAGDSMRYHNGRPFSTRDRDPSPLSIHCAKAYRGGWWYKNCYKANLNGLYATFSENQGVVWIDWRGKDASIPFTEMKLRPASITHTSQG